MFCLNSSGITKYCLIVNNSNICDLYASRTSSYCTALVFPTCFFHVAIILWIATCFHVVRKTLNCVQLSHEMNLRNTWDGNNEKPVQLVLIKTSSILMCLPMYKIQNNIQCSWFANAYFLTLSSWMHKAARSSIWLNVNAFWDDIELP